MPAIVFKSVCVKHNICLNLLLNLTKNKLKFAFQPPFINVQ